MRLNVLIQDGELQLMGWLQARKAPESANESPNASTITPTETRPRISAVMAEGCAGATGWVGPA